MLQINQEKGTIKGNLKVKDLRKYGLIKGSMIKGGLNGR